MASAIPPAMTRKTRIGRYPKRTGCMTGPRISRAAATRTFDGQRHRAGRPAVQHAPDLRPIRPRTAIGGADAEHSRKARSTQGLRRGPVLLARVTGLEPATSGVTGRRSNQLSYTRSGRGARRVGTSASNRQFEAGVQDWHCHRLTRMGGRAWQSIRRSAGAQGQPYAGGGAVEAGGR